MSLFKIFKGKAVNLPTDMHDGYAYFTTDDGKFYIDALVDGILKRTLINPTDDATGKVKSATVAEWAQQTSLTSEKDVIYVYTDHQTDDGKNIPGIKIGDGLTYVVDLPFVDTIYMKHITDTDIHITAEERAKWNKVNSAVPNTRTVNGKALSSDISLGAGDVGAYTKSETDTKIDAAVASAYKYKGSVTVDKLPTSGQVVGDVYNITNDSSYGKAGMNVAWNGTTWDALGSNVDLSNYVTTSDSRLSNARPANGGNASTVNGHTVNSDVPSGAKFTDTTYGAATQSSPGLMSAADKTKLDNLSSASTEGKEGVELTIPVSGWSSNTTAVNGTDYYTYSTTSITGISNPHPTIVCSSASGVLPSAEEKMAFDNIYFVTVDTSSSKITFYAPTKPNSTVVLIVKDFTAESTSSASANLTIATSDWSSSTTSINGAKYYTAKKTVSGINQAHPPVICHTASSSAALPSKAEQTAYNCIDYTTVDTSTNTITFYAMTKPSAAIALTMV